MQESQKSNDTFSAVGYYAGHSAKGNFEIELRLKFNEEMMQQAMCFLAGIGAHLKLLAVVDDEKVKLGLWDVYRVVFDRNAVCTLVMKTSKEYVDLDSLSLLMNGNEIIFKAKVVNGYDL